jgi:hypothetical protein
MKIPLLANRKKRQLSLDFSTMADGAIPGMIGSTWSIVSGKAVNTPTLGNELVADGGLEIWESDTNLTSWGESLAGTSTINKEASIKHGGSFSSRHDIDASNNNAQIYQALTIPAGSWLSVEYYRKASNGTSSGGVSSSGANIADFGFFGTDWVKRVNTGFVTTANPYIYFRAGSAPSASFYLDDITAKIITPTSLYAYRKFYTPLARISAQWRIQQSAFAGVIACLDNPSNPQNYVVLTHDGINGLRLIKCVGGIFTLVSKSDANYVAGAAVELRHTAANTWQMYYNGTKISTDQTISDTGIITNLHHGAFSANGGLQLDYFFLGVAQ